MPLPKNSAIARPDLLAELGVVDSAAPVVASGTIIVNAPAQRVWDFLADVVNWPSIRADIGEVHFDDVPRPGAVFEWSTGGVPLRSRFGIVEPGSRLTWTTLTAGLEAVHVYRFQATDAGGTRIIAQESMDAPAAPQLNSAVLALQIQSWIEGLKALAEREG